MKTDLNSTTRPDFFLLKFILSVNQIDCYTRTKAKKRPGSNRYRKRRKPKYFSFSYVFLPFFSVVDGRVEPQSVRPLSMGNDRKGAAFLTQIHTFYYYVPTYVPYKVH